MTTKITTEVGKTIRLKARLSSSTGDKISFEDVSWKSLNPGVLRLTKEYEASKSADFQVIKTGSAFVVANAYSEKENFTTYSSQIEVEVLDMSKFEIVQEQIEESLEEKKEVSWDLVRFRTPKMISRSVPTLGPYWVISEEIAAPVIIRAYVPHNTSLMQIQKTWPEAYGFEVWDSDTEIKYSAQFPKPGWWA